MQDIPAQNSPVYLPRKAISEKIATVDDLKAD